MQGVPKFAGPRNRYKKNDYIVQSNICTHRCAPLSEGYIDINEIDNVNNTISGHFHFDAYNLTGEYTINISEGVFYRIPITSEIQD